MLQSSSLTRDYVLARVAVNPKSKCWEWQLSANPTTGYGQIGVPPYTAHRLSYQLWVGDPTGLMIRHACHNRTCCNPEHLRGGSARDNYLDSLPAYQETWERRRGIPSKNAIPVVVDGVNFPSKVAAMRALRVGPATLARLIAH